MPTINITDSLHYFYSDTGAPATPQYRTLILLHGHTFHSGTFQHLIPLAYARSIRVICIHRRQYPGTSPLNNSEIQAIASGDVSKRSQFLEGQGIELAMLISELIKICGFEHGDGVTVAGWSLGALYVLAFVAAINLVDEHVKLRLQRSVSSILLWDPPSPILGIAYPPNGYSPIVDPDIPPEALGTAFGTWVSSYFTHGDFLKNGVSEINFKSHDETRRATTQSTSFEELSSMIDFSTVTDYDTAMVQADFIPVYEQLTGKALFDTSIRGAWKDTLFHYLYCGSGPWVFPYGACILQDTARMHTDFPIQFKVMLRENHFAMWESPEGTMEVLQDLIEPTKSNE